MTTANARPNKLLAEERRRKVLDGLDRDGRVTVAELVKRFGVSAVTARGDLDALAGSGSLVRSHGGAVRRLNPIQDYPLKFKETIHHAEKARIGQAAARLVTSGQTVVLDSGTTTAQVARHLHAAKFKSLTVITNALNIAMEFADAANITLILIGGILRHMSNSFVGPQAERMVRDLHADHFFLAVDGIDPEVGLSTPDILEAQLNSLMAQIANEVTVVTDASKFGRRSLSLIGPIECARRVITDERLSAEQNEALRAHGIEVLIA